ncbi:MAG: hypothetical protein IV100_14750 [Myxococcales bacterium]|nr:hypothetical protein [Myxococcales bacterium]
MLTVSQLANNTLTALPREIGQLIALELLAVSCFFFGLVAASPALAQLSDNALTSLPAELAQLSSLEHLFVRPRHRTTCPN